MEKLAENKLQEAIEQLSRDSLIVYAEISGDKVHIVTIPSLDQIISKASHYEIFDVDDLKCVRVDLESFAKDIASESGLYHLDNVPDAVFGEQAVQELIETMRGADDKWEYYYLIIEYLRLKIAYFIIQEAKNG